MIGIYKIFNTINGDCYVGSSIDLNKRYRQHILLLKKGKHHSIKLQRAIDKYGIDSFVFVVIETCEEGELKNKEQEYLNIGNKYNISKSSKSPMLGRKHSEETLKRFKSIDRPKGQDCYMFGRKWSTELREKILKSRIGKKRSEDFKTKQRKRAIENNYGDRIKYASRIKIIDDLGNVYDSLTDAAKSNGISNQTVCDILKGRHSKTRKGRSFKYYDEV